MRIGLMDKNRYLVIEESSKYKDSYGNTYPDIFTFPIKKFKTTEMPFSYTLTEVDIYRFDLLIYSYYGSPEYDDIVLWYNKIQHIADVMPGTQIELPTKNDIDNFYSNNI